jgi:hypothetical protein
MASWKNSVLVAAFVAAVVCAGAAAAAASKFDGVVQPSWANDHVLYEDDLLKLRLDSSSGKKITISSFQFQRLSEMKCGSFPDALFRILAFGRRGIRVQEQVPVWQGHRRSEARAWGLCRRRHRFLCE